MPPCQNSQLLAGHVLLHLSVRSTTPHSVWPDRDCGQEHGGVGLSSPTASRWRRSCVRTCAITVLSSALSPFFSPLTHCTKLSNAEGEAALMVRSWGHFVNYGSAIGFLFNASPQPGRFPIISIFPQINTQCILQFQEI